MKKKSIVKKKAAKVVTDMELIKKYEGSKIDLKETLSLTLKKQLK